MLYILGYQLCDRFRRGAGGDAERLVQVAEYEQRETSDKKQAIKTKENIERIIEFLQKSGNASTVSIAEEIGLSAVRTRELLKEIPEVEGVGANRNRVYRLKNEKTE